MRWRGVKDQREGTDELLDNDIGAGHAPKVTPLLPISRSGLSAVPVDLIMTATYRGVA
jgi:hypothetical protein